MQIYKVGGAVRDRLLGREVSEIDWVVVGASAEQMLELGYRPVGADFPVFLHPQTGEEYALARTERKSGRGYGGFTFFASPEVTLEEDLIRRDLTVNAMAEDDHGTLIDPYGGQRDLAARLLRHVSPAFAEDPLRVLRVARFAARYAPLGFSVAPETLALMRELSESGELGALTPERSWKEISRALMEPRPDVFIQVLRDCGALRVLLPEVDVLFGIPQPPAHHPEIDTGVHVLSVLRQCAEHQQPLTVRWACLLHDVGKGLTPEAEWPRHIAHEHKGLKLIRAINQRCKAPKDCQELALQVGEFHTHGHRALELKPSTLLKLLQSFDVFRRPQRFEEFIAACEMDARGRLGLEQRAYPQADYLRAAMHAARTVAVQPLLARGLQGAELGNALQEERLQALQQFRQNHPQA
ncbi:MAG: multifunctional CCA addition/repair protein [Pseudomonas sp.]|uniref:multifunctional CCA addition/repair protein n=1 Tax=Pseudomonas sp. TaxID=306 RepID=UPI00271EF500|nr:multifunctional CCA addition/repair protein [Pseudomonas sp.]MDO9618175.1 multifunctional CCA addition/repair protein [Pseudomonas sp.]MDP2447013.1 multifunctional CCA addition/repair protein [Pseudomonas sp.]MDZ4332327.1 multifunctional CCA addition/repair protein [Pseudomonas sp.]